ncbi:MAG: biotin/lipoyl-containing protein [Phycisphaerae bacterium]
MAEKTLIAKVKADNTSPGALLVSSPVVGMAEGAPAAGVVLNAFGRVVNVSILNERYVVRLPHDTQGRVVESFISDGRTPLAYGEPIARIDPNLADGRMGGAARPDASGSGKGREQDAGLITVKAPSEGIFYRRPSPDSPPYVEVGATVTSGSMLALVEIMKCFHQIAYGGPGLPEKGKVVSILAEDTSEVTFGQTLFHIKPLD